MRFSRRGGRGLEEIARGLRALAEGEHQPGMQKAIGEQAVKLVRQSIEDNDAPGGEPWAARRDGGAALQSMAERVEYVPLPLYPFECAIEVRVNHWAAHFPQGGTIQNGKVHNPRRPLIPDENTPPEWTAKVFSSAEAIFVSYVHRAMKGK